VARLLLEGAKKVRAEYVATGGRTSIPFEDVAIEVDIEPRPGGEIPVLTAADFPIFEDPADFDLEQPYRGWQNGLHEAYKFDSKHEALVAKMLDQASEVEWWVRNQPRRVQIPTPAGAYHPDFVVSLGKSPKTRKSVLLLLEVKGDIYWDGPESVARLKASAATEWCVAQTEVDVCEWDFATALESDIERCESWSQLKPRLLRPSPVVISEG
jgi:hypothetical protein